MTYLAAKSAGLWQLSSSAPGPPCLSASLPVVLRTLYYAASLSRPAFPSWPSSHRAQFSPSGSPYLDSTHLDLLVLRPLSEILYSAIQTSQWGLLYISPSHPVPSSELVITCLPPCCTPELGCSVSSGPDNTPSSNSQGYCIPLLTSY